MSKQSMAWSISIIASLFIIGSALTHIPIAEGGPPIPAGGQGGKIRAYSVLAPSSGTTILVPSVEGPNGFVITDFFKATAHYILEVDSGSGFVPVLQDGTGSRTIRFESGIAMPTGSVVRITTTSPPGGLEQMWTISGYTF